jgi:HAD superfamily hydrolase (TIGR01509 family)
VSGALPRLRAVLFDLDGVLVDSFETWLGIVNDAADRFGTPHLDRDHLARIFGQGIAEDARSLYPGHTMEEIRAAYEAAMPKYVDRMQVNPEAHAVLDDLRDRGIGRAVVTNTQDTLVTDILAVTGLSRRIDAVAAMAPGRREKPHPDLLLEALEALEVPISEAIMVGDTHYDEDAARAADVTYLHYELRSGASLSSALKTVGEVG